MVKRGCNKGGESGTGQIGGFERGGELKCWPTYWGSSRKPSPHGIHLACTTSRCQGLRCDAVGVVLCTYNP